MNDNYENSNVDLKDNTIQVQSQCIYVNEKLPNVVVTKGLQVGQILCYSEKEWQRFSNWLHNLPDDASSRTIRRHFIVPATEVEIEEENGKSRIPLTISLFEWVGGFENGGRYTWSYVERRADSWAARWELKNEELPNNKSKYDFITEINNPRYIKALLLGQKVISADKDAIILSDGTELEILLSERTYEDRVFTITDLNTTEDTISDVDVYHWDVEETQNEDEDEEILSHIWAIDAIDSKGKVRIIEVVGPDIDTCGCLFRVRYNNSVPFSERLESLRKME